MNYRKETMVIMIPGFPASEQDSTCLPFQQNLIRALQNKYPETEFIVFAFQYPYTTRYYQWNSIEVYPFGGRNRGGTKKLFLRRRIINHFTSLMESKKIIGILSFWYNECAVVGNMVSKRTGIPHYCWICGQDAKKENLHPSRTRLSADQLIALSDFLQEEFYRNHKIRPSHVIPPGIDPDLFPEGEMIREIDLLAVGSLIPLKKLEIFISVVYALKNKLPAIKAVIAGDGPEKKNLEEIVRSLSLQENISFTGELPYTGVLNLMKRAKLLIHPSAYEGFSGVCLEAVYAGTQVISFTKPMDQSINGWHIVNDKGAMTTLAEKLLIQPDHHNLAKFEFTIDRCCEKLIGLFSKVMIG